MAKTVLITGCSSGIGEETALYMKGKGWNVYATARRVERMKHLESQGIHTLSMDVTEDITMTQTIDFIIAKEGKIDALVNNAGYGSYGALEDVPLSEGKYQFEVNVFGLARLTQLVLPHMRLQQSGTIVNISSIGGKFGEPHGSWYHATKYAVEGLSDSLRMEVQQFGINVVVIEPGAIISEWSDIAQKKLVEVSGKTAYSSSVERHVNMLKKYDGQGSKPIVVAEVIYKACSSEKPKTRYTVGKGAKMLLTVRWLVSDRIFDKIMLGLMK
jgi:short-subunit dehydrogenase